MIIVINTFLSFHFSFQCVVFFKHLLPCQTNLQQVLYSNLFIYLFWYATFYYIYNCILKYLVRERICACLSEVILDGVAAGSSHSDEEITTQFTQCTCIQNSDPSFSDLDLSTFHYFIDCNCLFKFFFY